MTVRRLRSLADHLAGMKLDKAANPDLALRQLLTSLGLEKYADAFERNDVGLDVLAELTDADLKKLGLSLGHRRRLLGSYVGPHAGNS